jgi:hypothetical protein
MYILSGLVALLLCSIPASGYDLRGRIIHVGYPASGTDPLAQGADHYCVGRWTPINVELTNEEGDLFTGWIQVEQKDRDGDRILARKTVGFRGSRRDYLYIPGGVYERPDQFEVRVFEENGRLAPLHDGRGEPTPSLTPENQLLPVPPEARVVIDFSEAPVTFLRALVADERIIRDTVVARSSPDQMPDNVAGLDMADIIVWDEADPTRLKAPELQALIKWVERGGKLVLGVARTVEEVNQSPLADLLPARPGPVENLSTTDALAEDAREMLWGDTAAQRVFDPALPCCPLTPELLSPDARSLLPLRPESGERLLAAERPYGEGAIVLVPVGLRDLLRQAELKEPFLRQVLTIRRRPADPRDEPATHIGELDLFQRYLVRLTGFQITASVYFLLAFLFAALYIAAATGGSWVWLKHIGRTRHAWISFAAITIVASGISLVAVRLIRGIGRDVEEFTIVDGRAGSSEVAATSFFGLKTATHAELDLDVPPDWLNPDESPPGVASLWPLPATPDPFLQNVFSTPQSYEIVPDTGELHRVPLRATLKQFQAFWGGTMDGQLHARLVRVGTGPTELDTGSWIENRLGCDLDNCYLFVAARDFAEDLPDRSRTINVYPLGTMEADQKLLVHAALAAQQSAASGSASAGNSQKRAEPVRLFDAHRQWLSTFTRRMQYTGFGGGDEEEEVELDTETIATVVLLLTTFEEIDPYELDQRQRLVTRSIGTRLDRSDRITRDQALFVGFGRDPGPARLCWRRPREEPGGWRALSPARSRVVYRMAIPIEEPSPDGI